MAKPVMCRQTGCCHWSECPFCHDIRKCRTAFDVEWLD